MNLYRYSIEWLHAGVTPRKGIEEFLSLNCEHEIELTEKEFEEFKEDMMRLGLLVNEIL